MLSPLVLCVSAMALRRLSAFGSGVTLTQSWAAAAVEACACAAAVCPFDPSRLHAEVAVACPINLEHHVEQVSRSLVPHHLSLLSGTSSPGGPFLLAPSS